MGMDLKPVAPTPEAPLTMDGTPQWGHYNWTGWGYLMHALESWGIATDEFSGMNNGDEISPSTCRGVADAIESRLPEMSERDRDWLGPHVLLWRTCGGYQQF